MINRIGVFFFLTILLMFSCRREKQERLFEMVYPNIGFQIPAGVSPSLPRVFEVSSMATNIDAYLKQYSTDTMEIKGINPYAATLTSLDNRLDFDFIREISVRICPEGQAPCSQIDEMFYIDNLDQREDNEVRLLPSLRNAKKQLLKKKFKLEVVFFMYYSPPYFVESRLDLVFEAVK